jgi:hypothetical protein
LRASSTTSEAPFFYPHDLLAERLVKDRETPIEEVCEAVGVSRAMLYRYLKPDVTLRELLNTPPD